MRCVIERRVTAYVNGKTGIFRTVAHPGEGRPARVRVTFDLFIKKGLRIVLLYEYDDGCTLKFRSGGGSIAVASGCCHFKELSPCRSRFVFRVRVDFGMLHPGARFM